MGTPRWTASLLAHAVLGSLCLAAVPADFAEPAPPPGGGQRLAFEVADGINLNSFLQVGDVAAHLVLRAGLEPRLVVAFPAGDSGVGVWFAPTHDPVAWTLDRPPQPVTLADERGRPLYGIVAHAIVSTPELVIKQVLLSSVRVLRDYQTHGVVPPGVPVEPDEHGPTRTWSRDRLDGAAGYRLRLEVTEGDWRQGRITADRDGRIGMTLTAVSGEKPLTPLAVDALLAHPGQADRAAENVLRFLSYQEKFLAGSWRYDTYFGRDTLMTVRLLMPALSAAAVEDGLRSVLSRLSPTGEVAHEEEIGEYAILDHRRADGSRSDAPVFDYKMIDGSFMLAPVADAWLREDARGSSRAAAFLAREDGGLDRAPRSLGADLVDNLRFVVQSAQPFADEPLARRLISLKPGFPWGQWRDSDAGLARGRYPYDVNAVFVPAALAAAARFYSSGLLDPYLNAADRALLSHAADLAGRWRAHAGAFFAVTIPNATARRQIDAYARSLGVPSQSAVRAIGGTAVTFHALALDADGRPIPILHSDDGFDLLFGSPGPRQLDGELASLMRPFPAGLMTDAGVVVANPVFAAPEVQARFSNQAYHGTVIWSWQQAVLAAGLARQLARSDLPASSQEPMRRAQMRLWQGIDAGRAVINSELWSWSYRNGHYAVAPFGLGPSDADESNAAQLWSTVFLAVHAPPAMPPQAMAPQAMAPQAMAR